MTINDADILRMIGEKAGKAGKRYTCTISAIESRAAGLTRVSGVLDDESDFEKWTLPNVCFRIELPVRPEEYAGVEGGPDHLSRAYTVADCDVAERRIDIDLVVHGTTSPMMNWLAQVKVGDAVSLVNPKQHRIPGKGENTVLLADSTALPAALSITRGMELTGRVRLIAHVPADELEVAGHLPGVEVIRTDKGLYQEFLATDLNGVDSVWASGESGCMRAIRTHCREELGLDKEHTQVFGYWREGISATQRDMHKMRRRKEIMDAGGTVEDVARVLADEI